MKKDFLPYEQVRNNSLKLAQKIHKDGFEPDVVYVLLRGGAYIGNVISEYFKIVRKARRPVYYAAVVARSYTDIRKHERVMVDGWTYDPQHLRNGDRVLLVDDIFDSGHTINHLTDIILENGIPRESVRIAVHDYKVFTKRERKLPVQPDYYCRKHIIEDEKDDVWIHYMSHELVGLTKHELDTYYGSLDSDLRDSLHQGDV